MAPVATHSAQAVPGTHATGVRLEQVTPIASDVVALTLVPVQGRSLPAWSPGAHVDLVLPSGLVRQYSLCSSPDDLSRYVIAVLRETEGRGGSAEIHDSLRAGDSVEIRAPRNHFELADASAYVFVAGGIGITPIIAMVREAERRGVPWTLLYGGRRLESMAFIDQLRAFGDRVRLHPQDQLGMLPLGEVVAARPDGALVYCCGPEPLLKAVESLGLPQGTLRVERFVAKEELLLRPTFDFEIELERSGVTLRVPEHRSILEVVNDFGLDVPFSCEDGVCGTCETVVIAGQPDHRDSVMDPEDHDETRTMQICVSRCVGDRLVLDL